MSMSGSKRQRQLAREKYERQQARRSARVDKRRRNQRIIAVVVVVGLVFGGIGWALLATRSDDVPASVEPSASASASSSATASASPSAAASASPSAAASASPSTAASASPATSDPAAAEPAILDCTAPGTARPNDMTFASAPADGTAASLTLSTNCGDIVIALDPAAKATVASEVFLAQQGFYDNTTCHRLTTSGIFVLQCGDPAGDGTGGPGYTVPDENLPAEGDSNYPAGTVAMANAGPGTSGSQFFIVYDDTTLPAGYSVWGHVTEGLDMVKEVASVGVDGGAADGAPRQPVFIESATVQQN
jgi:peptidyl-prolyl cis-trans isomerase B (cyclophilin B)